MRYRAYAFDLDGTLYRGAEPIPGGPEAVSKLKAEGAVVLYLTNNSGVTVEGCAEKLAKMGYPAEPAEVYGTGRGAGIQLRSKGMQSAYVIGERGLAESIQREGIKIVNLDSTGQPIADGRGADAVVCGICRSFTFQMLDGALQNIRDGAQFVATNRDSTYPLEGGRIMPGAGSLVASVETCSGIVPFTVGKPNPFLLQLAMEEWDLEPEDTLVVGDRMDTDIACGQNAGCPTMLVLTGIENNRTMDQPYVNDVTELID